MRVKLIFPIWFLATMIVSGCTLKPQPYQYNHSESQALNIYKAAGLTGLTDTKITDGVYQSVKSGRGYALANGIVNYNSATFLNLSPWTAFSFGFLNILTSGNTDPKSDGIIAWMPTYLAKDKDEAKDVMNKLFYEAILKITQNKQFILKKEPILYGYTLLLISDPKSKCQISSKKQSCNLTFGYKFKSPETKPSFLHNKTKNSYFFYKSDSRYFTTNSFIIDKFEFLKELSLNLPEWVAFYLAPEKESNKKKVPLIINKGNVLYFTVPK